MNPSLILIVLSFMISSAAYAEVKMLNYPTSGQPQECYDSFQAAPKPQEPEGVHSAMRPICTARGGLRVMHKVVTSSESADTSSLVLLTCTTENPDKVLFTCEYSTTYEDL